MRMMTAMTIAMTTTMIDMSTITIETTTFGLAYSLGKTRTTGVVGGRGNKNALECNIMWRPWEIEAYGGL